MIYTLSPYRFLRENDYNSGEENKHTGVGKIGRFFLFVGLILLVVFFAVDQAMHPSYGYFCIGAVLTFLGGMMMIRGHKPPAESMRFRSVRRLRDQMRQRKEDKEDKPY